MKEIVLTLPTFGLIVSTRVALGVGIGLLLAQKLPAHRRGSVAAMLVAVGATATIPAVIAVVRSRTQSRHRPLPAVGRDARLVGATRFPRKGDDAF